MSMLATEVMYNLERSQGSSDEAVMETIHTTGCLI